MALIIEAAYMAGFEPSSDNHLAEELINEALAYPMDRTINKNDRNEQPKEENVSPKLRSSFEEIQVEIQANEV